MEDTLLIKAEEVMRILGVGRNTLYCDLLKREDFPCMKIGRNIYINKEGLKNWISNECKK